METRYTIEGMTCGHCVGTVRAAIGEVDGVTDVSVDLQTGVATVTTEREVERRDVQAAIEEVGYTVAAGDGAS